MMLFFKVRKPCAVCSAESLPSRPALFNPNDYSPPGSPVPGILQERILEWVPMPSSKDLPNPGIKPMCLTSPSLAGGFFTTSATWEVLKMS